MLSKNTVLDILVDLAKSKDEPHVVLEIYTVGGHFRRKRRSDNLEAIEMIAQGIEYDEVAVITIG